MKTIINAIFLSCFTLLSAQNPVAKKESVIQYENVRFTVLTPGLIRMEWDSTKLFTDKASFVAINRDLPLVNFKLNQDSKKIEIETSKLHLIYKKDKGRLSDKNLEVRFSKNGKIISWKPGVVNNGNLKGTARTLDGFNGKFNEWDHSELKLEDGLLSTEGWTFIDDSRNFLFDNSDWKWVEKRENKNCQDWYFFAYGNDYKTALFDYTQIAGKIPLPPRYAFGYWWSRYWNYTDAELRDLVRDFRKYQIPLDVLVIDMDWHTTEGLSFKREKAQTDEFGERKGWTGYTWNKDLFPNPERFLEWSNGQNLKTTFNLHPASGILAHEEKYEEFAQKYGFNTAGKKGIPFEAADKNYMSTLFDVILHPMQEQGVDFWWLDWQQWRYSKKIDSLSNTWWLNYCFFSDMERMGKQRPMLYHRWGGLGNHRYQIGFSGDAIITWESLAFQPYFTTTASNVLYGYWSHDIGGHMFGNWPDEKKFIDPELYTRWMQFGALSPVFRTHSSKDGRLKKEIWNFPNEYSAVLADAVKLRYSFAPYIYTMARKAYDTGISLCRPMYYDYPEKTEAYSFSSQYMFGDDVLVAPIISPMKDNFSEVKLWLPEGNDWFEVSTGTMLKGGQQVSRSFLINEFPMYVKAGSILPMYSDLKNLQTNPDRLILTVYPGNSGKTRIYEDEGDNNNYKTGSFTFTEVQQSTLGDSMQIITIFPRVGSFNGMQNSRSYEIVVEASYVPKSVIVNGETYKYSSDLVVGSWNYNGNQLDLHISLPEIACSEKIEISINYPLQKVDLNGFKGKMNRLKRAVSLVKNQWNDGAPLPGILTSTELTGLKINYQPNSFQDLILEFYRNYNEIPNVIDAIDAPEKAKNESKNFLLKN